jgi:hypothetical protein
MCPFFPTEIDVITKQAWYRNVKPDGRKDGLSSWHSTSDLPTLCWLFDWETLALKGRRQGRGLVRCVIKRLEATIADSHIVERGTLAM